jgi:hypothetical protein
MKEVKVKLFPFAELKEEIQEIIINERQSRIDFAEPYYYEHEETLKAFEELMGIKVKNWSVDSCRYDYRVKFALVTYMPDGYLHDVDGEEITGKYLWRYIMNNVWDDMFPRKKFYLFDAGYDTEKHRWNKQRTSKVIRRRWDECVLTGVCYDCDILEPIAKYLSKPINDNYTLEDLVHDCLDNFFSAWQQEIEYCNSYEGVKEWLTEYDGHEYYENGKVFNGVYEEEEV